MSSPNCLDALNAYNRIREELNCRATVYGTTTMAKGICSGYAPANLPGAPNMPKEDHVSEDAGTEPLIVSWILRVFLAGKPTTLSVEDVRKPMLLRFLRIRCRLNTSPICVPLIFHMFSQVLEQSIVVCFFRSSTACLTSIACSLPHGGYTNWSFLQARCMDALSLVVAPLADGDTSAVSIFEKSAFLPASGVQSFALQNMQRLEGDALWLRYNIE